MSFGNYVGETSLPSYTMVVSDSYATTKDFGDGKGPKSTWTLKGRDQNGKDRFENYNLGTGWSVEGSEISRPDGSKVSPNSLYGKLLKLLDKAPIGKALANLGHDNPFDLSIWVGLELEMEARVFSFGPKMDPVEKCIPVNLGAGSSEASQVAEELATYARACPDVDTFVADITDQDFYATLSDRRPDLLNRAYDVDDQEAFFQELRGELAAV